jgi:hypothetical protein
MNNAGMRRLCLAAALSSMLAACSLTGPEGDDQTISGEVPATAEAVFQKAEAWIQGRGYQTLERRSPTLLSARRALPGQDRTGRLDFTTATGTPTTTKYEIRTWSEVLGVQSRENDVEMQADAQLLSNALNCPAARWPSCP